LAQCNLQAKYYQQRELIKKTQKTFKKTQKYIDLFFFSLYINCGSGLWAIFHEPNLLPFVLCERSGCFIAFLKSIDKAQQLKDGVIHKSGLPSLGLFWLIIDCKYNRA
jgi:hypothetical protein